jgi:hypothetical protein
MYYFSPPERTFGVDPWDRSIEICRADGVLSNLAVSDYLPRSLPVGDACFGLIYAFSVFTHTSERATRNALVTLRKYIEPDGVLAITIRPREYWTAVAALRNAVDSTQMLADHDARGFAFAPHNRTPVNGNITYGDTSIALGWLAENALGWQIAAYDYNLEDPLKLIVYLMPATMRSGAV